MTLTDNDVLSFGALLRSFRQRQSLTQQHLAEAVGVHRNTIGRWEQGDVLPASKALVLELAKYLHLHEQETRHLLEASLTTFSSHWLVPLPRNLFFTGRAEILEALHLQLGSLQVVTLSQSSALAGLGGVGKTQIALEYAYRYALEYTAVFWIAAETVESIVASLVHIAEVLQLPGHDEKDQQHAVEAVQRWLSTHEQWLLIWDNVENLALLDHFLPVNRSGAILLTTRNQALGTLALGMELLPMEPQEGMLFLLRRAKVLDVQASHEQVQLFAQRMPHQYRVAEELVEAMAGLPLALDQAGAYLEETRCGLLAYRDLFRTQRAALLQQRGAGSRHHPDSVFTTFALAIAAATRSSPAVGDLLQVCALLPPDAIPEELFLQGGIHLGAVLQAICAAPLKWNQVLAVTNSYSLLRRQPEEQTFSLHRLVQAVLLESLTEEEHRLWMQRIIEAVAAVFPAELDCVHWGQCERLLPHALLCSSWLARTEKPTRAGLQVLSQTGAYLVERGRYVDAAPFLERALLLAEQQLGTEHPDTAQSLRKLANVYKEQGKYKEAESLYQRALAIREQQLGTEHPDTAQGLNNLANIYKEQGKYEQAEPLYQRALAIREQQLGTEHTDTAQSLHNLANLYDLQGKYEQAEPLYLRALLVWEQQLGPEHLFTAFSLNNLAELYKEQGRYEQAEPLYLRTLHIWEQQLGTEHPHTAMILDNLAELYKNQGRYEQAEPLAERALAIREQQLGSEHPTIAISLNTLAGLYHRQNKYECAERFYERALRICEQQLGTEHPSTARALLGLAVLRRDRGHEETEAEHLFVRTLAIRERMLVPTHPDLAETLHEFAIFRHRQSRWDEALSFYQRALAARSHTLGPEHPATLDTQKRLAAFLQERALWRQPQGKQHEALTLAEETVPGPRSKNRPAASSSHSLQQGGDPISLPKKHLQGFLDACCELHPLAWCRSADLWQAYVHWSEQHERFPFSRRALTTQLQTLGCQLDRTNTARIWRGIALISEGRSQNVTERDSNADEFSRMFAQHAEE